MPPAACLLYDRPPAAVVLAYAPRRTKEERYGQSLARMEPDSRPAPVLVAQSGNEPYSRIWRWVLERVFGSMGDITPACVSLNQFSL